MFSTVTVEQEDGVATVTMNRPERKNAFNDLMLVECHAALDQASRDRATRVIVLTGAGDAFCTGGDVAGMGEAISPVDRKALLWDKMQAIPRLVERIEQPVIAMVNGDAIGGGMDVALMCDMRIASQKARFSEAYVRIGLVPGDGGSYFLPRLVGMAKALELLLTGDFIDGIEAARLGVVNRAVPPERLRDETYALARKIASRPPLAVRLTKRLTYQSARADLSGALDAASSHVVLVQQSEDHVEAVKAFLEKRPGRYSGR